MIRSIRIAGFAMLVLLGGIIAFSSCSTDLDIKPDPEVAKAYQEVEKLFQKVDSAPSLDDTLKYQLSYALEQLANKLIALRAKPRTMGADYKMDKIARELMVLGGEVETIRFGNETAELKALARKWEKIKPELMPFVESSKK